MLKHGCAHLLRTENMISSQLVRTNSIFNRFNHVRTSIPASSLVLSRGFKGSKRNRRDKEWKKMKKLEYELEKKYGISNEKEFDVKAWLKKNYFAEFKAFQARLNIRFNDHKILMSAFAHPSFTEELKLIVREDVSEDDSDTLRRFEINDELSDIPFQKLSLLGYDTTLLAVKEKIYEQYAGITTIMCSDLSRFLTSRETISDIAKNLAIDDLLLLSRELENVEDLDKEYHMKFTKEDLLCDAFYSVVGAIVKDLGFNAAKSFVKDFVTVLMGYEDLSKHVEIEPTHAYRELHKVLQLCRVYAMPRPKIISESGIGTHFPFFHVGIFCNRCKIGEGSGYSAQTARLDAIKNTIYSCLEGDVNFDKLRQKKQ